jgi:hypothetical protein
MGQSMKKIPIQVSTDNISYMDSSNISYANLLNTTIELLRRGIINKDIMYDLSVKIQKGEDIENELSRILSK